MGHAREHLCRRFAVVAVVLGGHVLLVLLITSHRTSELRRQASTQPARSVLVLIEREPRREPPKSLPAPAIESLPRPVPPREQTAAPTSPAADAEGTPATAPIGIPSIDWRNEAAITVRKMAPKIAQEQRRICSEAKRIGAAPPVGCAKRSYEPNWKPELDQAGVIGGLFPYLRLGKRCVVALAPSFFGCGIGELPPPDGTLFDDMKDPNRPTSSVPDIDNGEAMEGPPPSVVLQDQ